MAVLNGGKVNNIIKGASLRHVNLVGTVKKSGTGVIRKILCYKKGFNAVVSETTSDASGDWSLSVTGGSNDEFRVICVGSTGENSEIYDHVVE